MGVIAALADDVQVMRFTGLGSITKPVNGSGSTFMFHPWLAGNEQALRSQWNHLFLRASQPL